MYPALAPDGGLIAFIRQTRALVSEIYVMPSAGGEPHRVTFDEEAIAGADWVPDGRKLVFSSQRLGPSRLWTVNVPRRKEDPPRIELLVSAGEGAFQPSVARHGRTLAFSRRQWTTNIWRLGASTRPGGELTFTRLIASRRMDTDPEYSFDGKRIAFSSDRSGSTEIGWRPAMVATPFRLLR